MPNYVTPNYDTLCENCIPAGVKEFIAAHSIKDSEVYVPLFGLYQSSDEKCDVCGADA